MKMQTLFHYLVLVASVAVNIALVLHVSSQQRNPQTTLEGRILAPLHLTAEDGTQVSVPKGDKPTVLYVFAPGCSWCAKNLPNLEALERQSKGRYQLVPISSESPEHLLDYAKRNETTVPLYTFTGGDFKQLGTPATLLLSPKGKVLRQWLGAYGGKQKEEIEKALGVTLPQNVTPD